MMTINSSEGSPAAACFRLTKERQKQERRRRKGHESKGSVLLRRRHDELK